MISKILLCCVKLYRYGVSPYLAPACRFYPTCSDYACQVLKEERPVRAISLITLRLLRCSPITVKTWMHECNK